MNRIGDITFIYDISNDNCYIQLPNQPLCQLTIKGSCERNGEVNGTWFQIDDKINHWISFRKDKFRVNQWEAFYKFVSESEIKYYRRIFYEVKSILLITFSFSKRDEWIKINGKWKSKF